MIAGRQLWLWRAVDDEGEVPDLVVQRRRDKAAAAKLMRKLFKKPRFRTWCAGDRKAALLRRGQVASPAGLRSSISPRFNAQPRQDWPMPDKALDPVEWEIVRRRTSRWRKPV